MIVSLRGKLVEKHPTRVVLEAGGLGYEALIPLSSYDRLPGVGEEFLLLTHYHVREDAHILFGFASEPERVMFRLLIGVTGIGPKLALSALSGLAARELKAAIVEGDVKRLSSVSGIGRKVAERMIVEMRDKIDRADALEAVAGPDPLAEGDIKMRDTVMALIALGYKRGEARTMTETALRGKDTSNMTVETMIRTALGKP
jgi:holliday junction DNA helicase RuvA